MKKLLLSALLVGLAAGAYAQGSAVAIDNNANTSTDSAATANGLFWIKTGAAAPVLTTADISIAVYAGTDSTSLSLLHLFSGAGAQGGNAAGPGTFTDLSGNSYFVTSATTASSGFFRIEAWSGTTFASYNAAVAGGDFAASSGIFSNPLNGNTSGSPQGPPPDLTGMPAIVLTNIPEPSSFALAGLGAAALLIFRRRK